MNALSKRRAVFLLLAALIASPSLFAGEYGLTVDPSFPHPCKYAATRAIFYIHQTRLVRESPIGQPLNN